MTQSPTREHYFRLHDYLIKILVCRATEVIVYPPFRPSRHSTDIIVIIVPSEHMVTNITPLFMHDLLDDTQCATRGLNERMSTCVTAVEETPCSGKHV